MSSWRRCEADAEWPLRSVTSGEALRIVPARQLMREIAEAAWECADPGVQFSSTINRWHTAAATGPINASNPCSEYLHLDNSACNLASLNLLSFLDDDGNFDIEGFRHAVRITFTAQEILVGNADYPTEAIGANTRRFRQLGLGYANLGALLMALGVPYDSDEGRAWAGSITALMTGEAYRTSARTAERMGPYDGYAENRDHQLRVMRQHRDALAELSTLPEAQELNAAAAEAWNDAVALADQSGVRNAQATVLAPTGTISFMMDCDTTGIEPDLGLVKTKKLVGGGTMSIVNQTVPRALKRLGYGPEEVAAIVAHIAEERTAVGAPGLRPEHVEVFACAMGRPTIGALGHLRMMAAAQPFLSGGISKTVNLSEDTTVDQLEALLIESWKLGIKAVAVYRDNCKVGQPLSAGKDPVAPSFGRRRGDGQRHGASWGQGEAAPLATVAHLRVSAWRTARAMPPSASTTTGGQASCSCGCPSRGRPWRASWMRSPSRCRTACSTGCRWPPTSGGSPACASNRRE